MKNGFFFLLGGLLMVGTTLVAQVIEEPVPLPETVYVYDDLKQTDSYMESLYKSATSTPEAREATYRDDVIKKLDRIEERIQALSQRLQ